MGFNETGTIVPNKRQYEYTQVKYSAISNIWPEEPVFLALRIPSWQRDASCNGADPALFDVHRPGENNEALALCADCPVKRECLQHVIGAGANHASIVAGGIAFLRGRALGSDVRLCPECVTPLSRRDWERPSDFRRRRYCDRSCANAAINRRKGEAA